MADMSTAMAGGKKIFAGLLLSLPLVAASGQIFDMTE